MSFGFEYGDGGFGGFGGMDPMGGYGDMGGGFMGGADAAQQNTPQRGGKANREAQTLLPLTIKQLLTASREHQDDDFVVDNQQLHHVKIVGLVLGMQEFSTNVTYQIEDGSGRIDVKVWIDKDGTDAFAAEKRRMCQENTMVRVIGSLREYEGKRHVLAYDLSPITEFNEVTHHFLETIHVHLRNKKGPASSSSSSSSGAFGAHAGGGVPMMTSPMGATGSSSFVPMGGVGMPGQRLQMGREDQLWTQLMEVFQEHSSHDEVGLALQSAFHYLRQKNPNATMEKVRETVQRMSEEGLVYTTIDEEHFKCT